MMQLIQGWKNSLMLFNPSQLKNFLLITAKSIYLLYREIFFYFWPLVVTLVAIHFWLPGAEVFVQMLSVFFMFVAARSSIAKKKFAYYMRHLPYFIPFSIWSGAICFFMVIVRFQFFVFLFPYLLDVALRKTTMFSYYISMGLISFIFIPLSILFTFFMLDSDGRIVTIMKSLRRACIMVFYNCPAIIFLYLFSIVIYGFLSLLIWIILGSWYPWNIFLMPIPISIFSNFYIKYIHAQFSLYFGEKRRVS